MIAEDLDRIARTHGIRLLLQFGSSVSGYVHPRSDIDIAVLLERRQITLEEQGRLLREIQGLFPDREVDLAILEHADPLFLQKVVENCRLLYGTPADLRRLGLHAFKRYQDYRRFLDLERRFVIRALADRGSLVDRELVTRKMVLILDHLRAVAPIAQKPLEEYLVSPTDEIVTERYLERMIGRMIDINYHLIIDAGHAPPRDYYESFTRLATLRVLAPSFASQIAACAGLRNGLVHEYDEIDPRRVYEGLRTAVRDIPEYLRRVQEHVENVP